jgi:5-formyltetrahydrofolate cyclo-ligase
LVEHVPMEDHDMKLNMIVSTDEVIRICRDWID